MRSDGCRGWRAWGSGRWRTRSGRSDPRILGTHARLSVPQAPTLDARTIPPPGRTAGTTLKSTHADDSRAASSASVCAHLLSRRLGAGRFFPSAPPASGFVRDYAIGAARQRGHSKRVCKKPPVTISENRAVPRALGSARWPASLLRVCAYRPVPYPLRNQDVHADCTLCRLLAWSCASRCVDVAACRLLSAAGRKTDAHLGNGAFRNMLQLAASPDDSQHPMALSRVDFWSLLAL